MTDILRADNLATLPGISHGFFTKAFGNPGLSREEERSDALRVRQAMAISLNVEPASLLSCYQIHSPDVAIVVGKPSSRQTDSETGTGPIRSYTPWSVDVRPRADALVTDMKGIALGVLTADCMPILFADPQAHVVGAAHAGWRGALSGVIENTLDAMRSLGARVAMTDVALGPAIWQKSYEVGPEFPASFLAENADNAGFFRSSSISDHYMFDLPGYIMARLHRAGVRSVEPSPADTCSEPERFFSHRYSSLRGEVRTGNLMSAIALV